MFPLAAMPHQFAVTTIASAAQAKTRLLPCILTMLSLTLAVALAISTLVHLGKIMLSLNITRVECHSLTTSTGIPPIADTLMLPLLVRNRFPVLLDGRHSINLSLSTQVETLPSFRKARSLMLQEPQLLAQSGPVSSLF